MKPFISLKRGTYFLIIATMGIGSFENTQANSPARVSSLYGLRLANSGAANIADYKRFGLQRGSVVFHSDNLLGYNALRDSYAAGGFMYGGVFYNTYAELEYNDLRWRESIR